MNITVFGAGAWGTAMALHCRRIGHGVTLVPKFAEQVDVMLSKRENVDFLPGVPLPEDIEITSDVESALGKAEVAFIGCPSVGLVDLCNDIGAAGEKIGKKPFLVSLCKGIQSMNLETASVIIKNILPEFEFGVLSGPTNAREVALGFPAAMVLAVDSGDAQSLQRALASSSVRIYTNSDVLGVELAGCLKNVYAIGAGVCDGLRLGDNAKAAYMTRALREMISIGCALGGSRDTFYGLSGFGDFVATCMGSWSRNRTFGSRVGAGESVEEIFKTQKAAVEGYHTSKAFHSICKERAIDAPIIGAIYAVLYDGRNVQEAVNSLFNRPLKSEL
ncbi:MAG: NAD(P)-dependent glycerol-3-phosphate dehydrogenase [Puniceicoccales bacterium]|jgi:glycerol-3-phosphate dehydrogenase (NAD(P)+)|nr:NAD(P)-dependent glycerol-3-phosphate dehydrogenase [Puniceicoccales bacterium]